MNNPVRALQATELKKAFGATQALRGATLGLASGEVHALLGENGSGKSTFSKIISGIYAADSGTILRSGQRVAFVNPAAARAGGVGMVFQELSLAPDLTVVDNMFLGRERSASLRGWLNRKAQRDVCATMLQRLGLDVHPDTPVRLLRMAQKQMIEIGKALLDEPDILIFDEPTASLTQHEIGALFKVIGDLRKAGKAMLYVTHHLREVLRVADRVSVMREGRIVAECMVDAALTEEALVGLLTEKRLDAEQRVGSGSKAPLLRIENLKTTTCPDISLSIGKGEIVGIYGVVGCGREEIGRTLVGLHSAHQGKVELGGAALRASNPADALAQGVGFLPTDRKQEGILPNRPIRENLTLSNLASLLRGLFLSGGLEQKKTGDMLARLRVKYASSESLITSLSGGNQQKVLFGRVLSAEPRLLVLEDPTAGIDIGAKYDLYEQIREHAAAGTSFLWMSSDLTETLTLCHRVYAMYSGHIIDHLESPSLADEERVLAAVLGRDRKEAAP
jgi:ribose transport system ATP-binding protein